MSVDLQLKAALLGDFDKELRQARRRVGRAISLATFDYGEEVKAKWRQDVERSGLAKGERLSKTIQHERKPNASYSGLRPASVVKTKIPKIIAAFEEGREVRPKSAKYLLIPNPDVWPTGRVTAATRTVSKTGTYSAEFRAAESRYGPLSVVPPRAGKVGLVLGWVRSGRGAMKYRGLTGAQRGRLAGVLGRGQSAQQRATIDRTVQQVPIFFLVKSARLPRLLKGATIRERAGRDAAREIERRYVRLINQPDGVLAITDAGGE